ncbi:hypothetical protein V1504DRAFT_442350 [Lipomyces starkeyi]
MSMIPMTIAKIDHSFKSFTALFSCINEYGEIRVMNLTATKSLSEVKYSFGAVAKALEQYSHPPPNSAVTKGVAVPDRMSQIPYGFTSNCDDVLMRTLENELRGDASSTPNGPVDAEWDRGSDSADLVQLAFKDTVVLIRLYRMRECPILLQQLLASPALMKVGCTLCKDLGFVEKAQVR